MAAESIERMRVPMHILVSRTVPEGRRVIVDLNDLGIGDVLFINSSGEFYRIFYSLKSFIG